MKKSGISILLVFLLSIVLIAGCSKQENIIGEVNGQAITAKEYDAHLGFLKYYYEVSQGIKLDEDKNADIIDTLNDQTFEDLVLKQILWQEADKENILIGEEILDQEIENAKKNQGEDSFKKILDETGMSEKLLRDEIKTEKIYAALQERITADIKIDDAEIADYYSANAELFTEEGGMEIAHILVADESQAVALIDRLKKGDDFAQLAKEFSSCPSNAQGGDLGLVNENSSFVSGFKEAALQLKEGEITGQPVKSEFGFHIIKAGKIKEAGIVPLEEIKDQLKGQLLENKKREAYFNYLQGLQNNADIKDMRGEAKSQKQVLENQPDDSEANKN